MANKEILRDWLLEALRANNGSAPIIEVCKYVWYNYEDELRKSSELFFTWQYDIRWTATQLRKEGVMRPAEISPQGIWELAE